MLQCVLKANPGAELIVTIKTTRNDHQSTPTVIVSRPGIMQQSLRASLADCRGIDVVATSGDGLTAWRQVAKLRPELLVIDSNLLDQEVEALLAAAKAEQPALRCLVLVRSSLRTDHLLTCGADEVVARNGSGQDLHEALFRLARDITGQRT